VLINSIEHELAPYLSFTVEINANDLLFFELQQLLCDTNMTGHSKWSNLQSSVISYNLHFIKTNAESTNFVLKYVNKICTQHSWQKHN